MNVKHRVLLGIDGAVNLVLGALLLGFPLGTGALFGAPEAAGSFYPSILGAVIFGIGVALLLELFGGTRGLRGLGLGGAIAINIVGGGVLTLWLLIGDLDLPLRGWVTLWVIAVVVVGAGVAELLAKSWRY